MKQLTEAGPGTTDEQCPVRPLQTQPERTFIMNRTIRSIAAVAALMGATSVFAAGPAAGEFSAVDQYVAPAASALTRATVTHDATTSAQSAHKVNGEIVQEAAASSLTREQAREQGRTALRTHTMSVGDSSL